MADPAVCGDLFNPVGTRVFTSPCDTAARLSGPVVGQVLDRTRTRQALASRSSSTARTCPTPTPRPPTRRSRRRCRRRAIPKAGDAQIVKMSNPFDIFRPQVAAVIGLLFILVLFVTMVYGPIAAMLVELFPTRIRYTSMSLPYHIGNGWFGGLLPATAFAIVASDRQHLLRALVPDHLRGDHRGHRHALPAGDQGRRHQRKLISRSGSDAGKEFKSKSRGAIRGFFLYEALRLIAQRQ